MRRPTAKQLDKAFQALNAAMLEYFNTLGLRKTDSKSTYPYVLDTPAGLLRVAFHDGAVFTNFDDLDLGRRFTQKIGKPCNPYTGKWNFHFYNKNIEDLVPIACLSQIEFWIRSLMNWDGDYTV